MIVTPAQLKMEACQTEIDAVLAKYKLKFEPFVLIRPNGVSLGVNYVPANALVPMPNTTREGGKVDGQ